MALSPSCCPSALLVCLDGFQSCVSCSPAGMELETTPLDNDSGLFLPVLEGSCFFFFAIGFMTAAVQKVHGSLQQA